jgi:hypothetical protein
LGITRAEFDKLAKTVYRESSGGVGESTGIVNVLENRATADGSTLMTQVSDKKGYGVFGVRSNAYSTEKGKAADQKRANTHMAIAEALSTGKDNTNGAYFWDGKDFDKNAHPNGGYRARYVPGYLFTNASHDLYGQGSHPVNGTYRYQSTAVIGSTTFSRKYNQQGNKWR